MNADFTVASIMAGVGPEAARSAAPAPAGLPGLLNSNSSNEELIQLAIVAAGFELSPYQRKALFALTENIIKFINDVGLERVGFLTLTFDHKVFDLDEASACFNRLNVRVLKEFFGRWVRVIEQHKDGSWHYHLLVEMPCDIRTGFDFEAFEASKKKYKKSGRSAEYYRLLRASTGSDHPLPKIWKALRQRLKGYHFGRFELVPIRTNQEGMSRYLAKYLSKGLTAKRKDGRRVRLTAFCRKVKRAVYFPFAWVSSGARLWRKKVSMTAEHFACKDMDDISIRFGPHWAYHFKDRIAALIPSEMTHAQSMRQSTLVGATGLLCESITYPNGDGQARHAYDVCVRLNQTDFHAYDRASWNDLIFRAMACNLKLGRHSSTKSISRKTAVLNPRQQPSAPAAPFVGAYHTKID